MSIDALYLAGAVVAFVIFAIALVYADSRTRRLDDPRA